MLMRRPQTNLSKDKNVLFLIHSLPTQTARPCRNLSTRHTARLRTSCAPPEVVEVAAGCGGCLVTRHTAAMSGVGRKIWGREAEWRIMIGSKRVFSKLWLGRTWCTVGRRGTEGTLLRF
jgi:hypothetical protein